MFCFRFLGFRAVFGRCLLLRLASSLFSSHSCIRVTDTCMQGPLGSLCRVLSQLAPSQHFIRSQFLDLSPFFILSQWPSHLYLPQRRVRCDLRSRLRIVLQISNLFSNIRKLFNNNFILSAQQWRNPNLKSMCRSED